MVRATTHFYDKLQRESGGMMGLIALSLEHLGLQINSISRFTLLFFLVPRWRRSFTLNSWQICCPQKSREILWL